MAKVGHVTVNAGDVLLLLGTAKGVFMLRSGAARDRWEMGGPFHPGHKIYALAYDGRNRRNGSGSPLTRTNRRGGGGRG